MGTYETPQPFETPRQMSPGERASAIRAGVKEAARIAELNKKRPFKKEKPEDIEEEGEPNSQKSTS